MPDLQIQMPSGGITKGMIASSAGIEASKIVRHQSVDVELFEAATAITAITKLLHIVRGTTGTILGFEAIQVVDTTGADRTVTIDLKKSTGGGALATVLSSTIGFADGTAIYTPQAAVISNASLVDGDVLAAVVTVAGASGNAAKGLLVTLHMEETYT